MLNNIFKTFLESTRGSTAIEYGLIGAGIALAIAVSVFAFGDSIYDLFYSGLSSLLSE